MSRTLHVKPRVLHCGLEVYDIINPRTNRVLKSTRVQVLAFAWASVAITKPRPTRQEVLRAAVRFCH